MSDNETNQTNQPGKKPTRQNDVLATHLIIIGNTAAPMLLCDKHTKAIIELLTAANMPYECIEIVSEKGTLADTALDPEISLCQACDLSALTKPEIILPN